MVRVGIVGATGYAGMELIRILARHPSVELAVVVARHEAGRPIDEVLPHLWDFGLGAFQAMDPDALARCDAVFFATPHGTTMDYAPALVDAGVVVVDLSADFRIKDPALWALWYGFEHRAPQLLEQAVYALPELNRGRIAESPLLACPGCYPTGVLLAAIPLLRSVGEIPGGVLIADAKSGVSGAGRKAAVPALMAEAGEGMQAYAVSGHRHQVEIEQAMGVAARPVPRVIFVPHLVPMVRGIAVTLYAQLPEAVRFETVVKAFEAGYAGEPFVHLRQGGLAPHTRDVRGTNRCVLQLHRRDPGVIVVLSVIDNLIKGAAGQAVQAFNCRFGLPETLGLDELRPLVP